MNDELHIAQAMLKQSGVSMLDAARMVLQILDGKRLNCSLGAVGFCTKVIQRGLAQLRQQEMSVREGFDIFLKTKSHLRPDSLRDIKYLGKRILANNKELAGRYFADISLSECEQWLNATFTTPSQFNKGRTMLHALFTFAQRHEWCDRNIVKLVEKRRVLESVIAPLHVTEARTLLKESTKMGGGSCSAGVGLLIWAGLRPTELRRLSWGDVDLSEATLTVRAQCSKTGGIRHIDICPPLMQCLKRHAKAAHLPICPPDWAMQWRRIREAAGFKGRWVQDVLRHTYASYHAKHFKDLRVLQVNMGHRDLNLLRSRYVNMQGITSYDAKRYFARCT
ncbi:MAG: tyrosine-type recombinase/integrase [Akkermansia sp.]